MHFFFPHVQMTLQFSMCRSFKFSNFSSISMFKFTNWNSQHAILPQQSVKLLLIHNGNQRTPKVGILHSAIRLNYVQYIDAKMIKAVIHAQNGLISSVTTVVCHQEFLVTGCWPRSFKTDAVVQTDSTLMTILVTVSYGGTLFHISN